jgi:hypothetical protein
MPIHINLLAEAQAAEELRRRDPVKRAIFLGISLVAVFLVWSAMVEAMAMSVRATEAGVETEVAAHTNEYARVEANMKQLNLTRSRLAALQKLQDDRFLQGNLLNALQLATVPDVQLTALHLDQGYSLQEGTPTQTNSDGRVVLGRPSTVREKITLNLDARDFSANPGDQVNKFMQAIEKQPYFEEMLAKTNAVQLTSPPSAPVEDGGKVYVTFSLECQFPDVTR